MSAFKFIQTLCLTLINATAFSTICRMHWALRFAASVFFLLMVERVLNIAPLKMQFPQISVFYITVALSIFDIRLKARLGDFLFFSIEREIETGRA